MINYIEQVQRAKRAAYPIILIETPDQQNTVRQLSKQEFFEGIPIVQWDLLQGLTPYNDDGVAYVADICEGANPAMVTANPTEMLLKINNPKLPRAIIFMHNAHRFIENEGVSQGVANLRDPFKEIGSMLVMLAPFAQFPEELKFDIGVITETLPDYESIKSIVTNLCEDADAEVPEDVDKIADTLVGLSGFAAEQTLAISFGNKNEKGKREIDREMLWDRKCKAIAATPGLSVFNGKEKFDDIGGCANVKNFLSKIMKGKNSPTAVVFLDEIEKAFAGSGTDSSGVSQDQLGAILSFMQDNKVRGLIFIGPPGAAKSAIAKAAGNEGGRITIQFDLGAMKNSLVGESGKQTRGALKVIDAVSQGRALFIATCNSIGVLPPELRRRFTRGTFFFDLPTKEDRDLIWNIYSKKYAISEQEMPDDEGWTGAEIEQCSLISSDLDMTLKEASNYIVPVAKSAAEQIADLRRQAQGKFIDASKSGAYMIPVDAAKGARRKFEDDPRYS